MRRSLRGMLRWTRYEEVGCPALATAQDSALALGLWRAVVASYAPMDDEGGGRMRGN